MMMGLVSPTAIAIVDPDPDSDVDEVGRNPLLELFELGIQVLHCVDLLCLRRDIALLLPHRFLEPATSAFSSGCGALTQAACRFEGCHSCGTITVASLRRPAARHDFERSFRPMRVLTRRAPHGIARAA